jgi:CheY-like chemotaxis protein
MNSQTLNKSLNNAGVLNGNARHRKVMLIDDNSLDNFINKKLLETNGFAETVSAYESPEDALSFLKTAPSSELPEVIFLDINMPGMDGFQFLDAFENLNAAIHQQCKIIMLSTSESFKDLNRANKNKFVSKFLNKPLTPEAIGAIKV